MDTRQLIAYAIIALILMGVVGVAVWQRRKRRDHRDAMRGRHRYRKK